MSVRRFPSDDADNSSGYAGDSSADAGAGAAVVRGGDRGPALVRRHLARRGLCRHGQLVSRDGDRSRRAARLLRRVAVGGAVHRWTDLRRDLGTARHQRCHRRAVLPRARPSRAGRGAVGGGGHRDDRHPGGQRRRGADEAGARGSLPARRGAGLRDGAGVDRGRDRRGGGRDHRPALGPVDRACRPADPRADRRCRGPRQRQRRPGTRP